MEIQYCAKVLAHHYVYLLNIAIIIRQSLAKPGKVLGPTTVNHRGGSEAESRFSRVHARRHQGLTKIKKKQKNREDEKAESGTIQGNMLAVHEVEETLDRRT